MLCTQGAQDPRVPRGEAEGERLRPPPRARRSTFIGCPGGRSRGCGGGSWRIFWSGSRAHHVRADSLVPQHERDRDTRIEVGPGRCCHHLYIMRFVSLGSLVEWLAVTWRAISARPYSAANRTRCRLRPR